ncbi:hypothetical protein FEM08_27830 [Flavobacterium gilvum]|nr:hypothetical protein FEM08_27830 [Flavobacterium gilvum]
MVCLDLYNKVTSFFSYNMSSIIAIFSFGMIIKIPNLSL